MFASLPSKKVVDAIAQLNYHVSPAQVSIKTGISIDQAESELVSLLKYCGEGFEIEGEGSAERIVLYKFPKTYKLRLANRSVLLRLNHLYRSWSPIAFKALRSSFGVFLGVSIASIVIVWFVILIYTRQGDNNQPIPVFTHFNRPGGFDLNDVFTLVWLYRDNPFFIGANNVQHAEYRHHRQEDSWRQEIAARRRIRNAVLYNQVPHEEDITDHSQHSQESYEGDAPTLNFLESIFSFMFGEGHPGPSQIDRWCIIAAVIKRYNGGVTADILRPYVADDKGNLGREEFMLQILAKFRGKPVVTPDGQLTYFFPEFTKGEENDNSMEIDIADIDLSYLPYFKENEWIFSYATENQRNLAIGLGIFNLFGTIWLRKKLRNPALLGLNRGILIVKFFGSLSLGFIVYAVTYLLIPAIRYLVISKYLNPAIHTRNIARQEIVDDLDGALADSTSLQSRKLKFIEDYVSNHESNCINQDGSNIAPHLSSLSLGRAIV